AMTPMADNLKKFASAANSIPNSGGFIGDFMGSNDIDSFGKMLASFVTIFAVSVTENMAKKAAATLASAAPMAENLKQFAIAASNIPSSGGFLSAFFGTVDLSTFSSQIHGLIDTFSSVEQSKVILAASALKTMSDDMLPAL